MPTRYEQIRMHIKALRRERKRAWRFHFRGIWRALVGA